MKRTLLLALVLLAACQRSERTPTADNVAAPVGLETAAIQAGVIPDPANTDVTGLFARDTDRVCVVPSATAYRIGVFVDYGDDQSCSASGTATRVGETLHVRLHGQSDDGCSFDARFEGDRIVFPGTLPDACQQRCSKRASMSGLMVERIGESVSEASTLRDANGRLLCASAG